MGLAFELGQGHKEYKIHKKPGFTGTTTQRSIGFLRDYFFSVSTLSDK